MQALIGGRVLNPEYQQLLLDSVQMEEPDQPAGLWYGYGITQQSWGSNTMLFHGGETAGHNSFMGVDAANDMTLVVWTNLTVDVDTMRQTANSLMLQILDQIYVQSPLAPASSAPAGGPDERRRGPARPPLLSHISATDTVRDLDRLRELIGEETITYAGQSYGTMIGQIYASMFPDRVRAMMLDGIVYRSISSPASRPGTPPMHHRPTRCSTSSCGCLTRPVQTSAHSPVTSRQRQRASLGCSSKHSRPIPAPNANPPGELHYNDLTTSSFAPLRDPHLWPEYAEQLNAAVDGDVCPRL